MALRTKTVNISDSRLGFMLFSSLVIGLGWGVPVLIIALIAREESIIFAMGVGAGIQIGMVAILWVGIRPLFRKAVYRLGFLRKVVGQTAGSRAKAFKQYMEHWWKDGTLDVVYARIGETNGTKTAEIEFVSNRMVGAVKVKLDDLLNVEDVTEFSAVSKEKYDDRGYCTLVNDCEHTKLQIPVFDTLHNDRAPYYYSCQYCLEQLMDKARERLVNEQTSETMARII